MSQTNGLLHVLLASILVELFIYLIYVAYKLHKKDVHTSVFEDKVFMVFFVSTFLGALKHILLVYGSHKSFMILLSAGVDIGVCMGVCMGAFVTAIVLLQKAKDKNETPK